MNVRDIRDSVGRRWWTLERFGFTPAKLARRAAPGKGPKVFCVSVPKAGTHLLERALCLHPQLYRKLLPTIRSNNLERHGGIERVVARLKPGQLAMSHLHFDPTADELFGRSGVGSVFLIRDPRDMVVSEAFYLVSGDTRHRLHRMFAEQATMKDRIMLLLRGDPEHGVVATGRKLERYAGWLDSQALVVRFEDLVGAAGGGDDDARTLALRAVFEHLGLASDDELVAGIGDR